MSFEQHATYGPVTTVGLDNIIYLNHSFDLALHPLNRYKSGLFFFHCMALNKEEALDLINSLNHWLCSLETKAVAEEIA